MRSEERVEQLESMVREQPEDRDLRYFLATEYFKQRRFADCLQQLEAYFQSGDDEGVGYKMRGICLFHLGRKDESRAALATGVTAATRHHHADLADEIEDTLSQLFPSP